MPHDSVEYLRAKTQRLLAEKAVEFPGVAGFAVLDLTTGDQFGVHEDVVFSQASCIKTPILMELYKQASEGRLSLDERHEVGAADHAASAGVLRFFGDGTSSLALRDLAVLMIALSDNTATNILIDRLGMENITATMRSLGLEITGVHRRMMDLAPLERGIDNASTPAEAARIMRMLHHGEFLDRAACNAILDILRTPKQADHFRDGLEEFKGPKPTLAQKCGHIPGVTTEWAIVELPGRPYVLIGMAKLCRKPEAMALFRDVALGVHEYFWRIANASPHGAFLPPAN